MALAIGMWSLSNAGKNFSEKLTRGVKNFRSPIILQKFSALLGLIFLSPLLLGVALAIRLGSPGAALYTQVRVGQHGRRFKIYKFRSMRIPDDPLYPDMNSIKSDREGVCVKMYKDPRITGIGRVIRKLSIDELPQLWNVVLGDMALIGPRPALVDEVGLYDYDMMDRLNTLPGLTGLWQVSGRADTTFEQQIQLDLRYVSQQSVWLDLRILLLTVPAVLFGKGAY